MSENVLHFSLIDLPDARVSLIFLPNQNVNPSTPSVTGQVYFDVIASRFFCLKPVYITTPHHLTVNLSNTSGDHLPQTMISLNLFANVFFNFLWESKKYQVSHYS